MAALIGCGTPARVDITACGVMPANITVEGQPHRRGAAAGLSHHRCDIGVYGHFHR
mgnify:CR=1